LSKKSGCPAWGTGTNLEKRAAFARHAEFAAIDTLPVLIVLALAVS
jgi:hypothetical protein